ncbi:MAG: SWIM zinc finger family protein [Candidatus Brockarchaeota archaeon]|nr:SWIM zinc finger family protein [Candidatus Brockarchaeota archaeon]
MGIDRMMEKAMKLVKQSRVYRTDIGQYEVVGDHGTYRVVKTPDGMLHCSCLGFQQRKKCSHVGAVVIFESRHREKAEWWKY